MKYVISGASAQIGRLVTSKLLLSISPSDLTLISRNPDSLKEFADRGVNVFQGHHGEADGLAEGYRDADALFMISSRAGGQRANHHKECIRVAKSVGVKHITYTSSPGAHPSNPTPSAADHLGTEYLLYDSGLSFAALRSQTYSDLLYGIIVNQVLKNKRMVMNSEHGRLAPISRKYIASCAAAIMLNPSKHDRVCYEITGPERFTWPQIAELAAKVWDTEIEFFPISTEKMFELYERAGVPFKGNPDNPQMHQAMGAEELTLQMEGYEQGYLDILSGHVKLITGHEPQSLETVWREKKAQQA